MALAYCTKCGHQVSTAAPACPECGAPPYSRPVTAAEVVAARLESPPPTVQPGTATSAASFRPAEASAQMCPNCGRHWGEGRSCQFCKQVEGLPTGVTIASPMRRLGGYLADLVIVAVAWTFIIFEIALLGPPDSSPGTGAMIAALLLLLAAIGIIIWTLYLLRHGQSGGKLVTGIRIVKINEARAAGFGTCLLREFIAKPVIVVLSVVTLGIVNFWLVWDKDTQELWDKVVGTIVVNDSKGVTVPRS